MFTDDNTFSEFFGGMVTEPRQEYCPNCRCNILDFKRYVGTTTVTATNGKGSFDERRAYFKLYGVLMFTVPHYSEA